MLLVLQIENLREMHVVVVPVLLIELFCLRAVASYLLWTVISVICLASVVAALLFIVPKFCSCAIMCELWSSICILYHVFELTYSVTNVCLVDISKTILTSVGRLNNMYAPSSKLRIEFCRDSFNVISYNVGTNCMLLSLWKE